MRILNAAQMRAVEQHAIKERGIASFDLMQQAGRCVVEAIDVHFPGTVSVVVLCGPGNNGGDGWVVARLLHERGGNVHGLSFAPAGDIGGDARIALDEAIGSGVNVTEISDVAAWKRYRTHWGLGDTPAGEEDSVVAPDLIIDALIGTGLNRPLKGLLEVVVQDVMDGDGLEGTDDRVCVPIVAIDVPSGLSSDTGQRFKGASNIWATMTVTFVAPKFPHVLRPAANAVGKLVVAPLEGCDLGGSHAAVLPPPMVSCVEWKDFQRRNFKHGFKGLVARNSRTITDYHKGQFGRVSIVAGSVGKTGAAQLAGLGALRGGAGLVTMAVPEACVGRVTHIPEYMTFGLPDRDGTVTGEGVDALLDVPCDVIAVGPGLGTGPGPLALVKSLLERSDIPLVLDADALNVLAGHGGQQTFSGHGRAAIVITPHPGEFARLIGLSVEAVQCDRVLVAQQFAVARKIYVVLKGAQTVVATPAGGVSINTTGNPGMATGGSGDVLTGVIAAGIAQVLTEIPLAQRSLASACEEEVTMAIQFAVHLHGLAGDLAATDIGETGLIASDIAAYLGRAVLDLSQSDTAL